MCVFTSQSWVQGGKAIRRDEGPKTSKARSSCLSKKSEATSACAGVLAMAKSKTVSGRHPATFQRVSGTSHNQPCIAPVALCNLGRNPTSSRCSSRRGGSDLCVNMWSASPRERVAHRDGGCHIGLVCCRRGLKLAAGRGLACFSSLERRLAASGRA